MIRDFFRIEWNYWLLAFPILHMTIPWLHYRFKASFPFLFLCVWLFFELTKPCKLDLAGIRLRRAFSSAAFWFIFYYFLLQIFYAMIGFGSFPRYSRSAAILTNGIYFFVSYFVFRSKKFNEIRFLTCLFLIGFTIAGVSAVRGLNEGLEGARAMMASEAARNSTDVAARLNESMMIGLGRYEFIYYCSMLIAPLAFSFVVARGICVRIVLSITCLACLLCVRGGGLGTPVVVSVFGLSLVCIWLLGFRKKGALFASGMILISLLFFYATRPTIFSGVSKELLLIGNYLSEGAIKQRVISVADTFSGDKDTYAYNRFLLQMKSLNAFKESPLFGIGAYEYPHIEAEKLGGHSMVFDTMGQYGILGLLLLFMMLKSIFKFFINLSKFYLGFDWLPMPIIAILSFVFAGILNPIPCVPGYFFVLLPGLALLLRSYGFNRHKHERVMRPYAK